MDTTTVEANVMSKEKIGMDGNGRFRKILLAKVFAVIVLISLVFSVSFVSFSLTQSAPPDLVQAIGVGGQFSYYFQIQTLENKGVYGFIVGTIVFCYFVVILSVSFIFYYSIYVTKTKYGSIRGAMIMFMSYLCCSLKCLKALGINIDNGSRRGLIVNFNEESAVFNKYGSVQAGFRTIESSGTSSTDRTHTKGSYVPVIVENPVVSDYDEDDLDPDKEAKEEYNPFDTDSFRRRERHATFHGWGNKTQKPQSPSQSEQQKDILSSFKRLVKMEEKPQPPPTVLTPAQKDVHSLQDLRVQALLKQQQQDPHTPEKPIEILPTSLPQRKPRASVSSIDKTSRNMNSPNNTIGSLPVLPTVPVRRNSNKRSNPNNDSNTSQPQNNDNSLSRSMEVFPREILINPEYRTLLDSATRHIRLLSNHKKKQETANDIPSVADSPSPKQQQTVRLSRDSDFDSETSDWEYDVAYSPGSLSSASSEKDFLTTSKILIQNPQQQNPQNNPTLN